MQASCSITAEILAKEVQDLKETLEVSKVAWGRGAGRCDVPSGTNVGVLRLDWKPRSQDSVK